MEGRGVTPLYRRLVKRLTLPEKKREPLHDPHGLLADLSDVHCFDCGAAIEVAHYLLADRDEGGGAAINEVSHGVLFAPARRTWIECPIWGNRSAIFYDAIEGGSTKAKSISHISDVGRLGIAVCRVAMPNGDGDLVQINEDFGRVFDTSAHSAADLSLSAFAHLMAFLAIINTPNIVDRAECQAHKSLAREIAKREGAAFKLHPWHQIKLEIFKPRHISDGEPHEDVITGRRALHFCRAFIRIRLGRLEHVRSHWRGDPEFGIRQASYKVRAA
jgi:hypothetical protein